MASAWAAGAPSEGVWISAEGYSRRMLRGNEINIKEECLGESKDDF